MYKKKYENQYKSHVATSGTDIAVSQLLRTSESKALGFALS